MLLDILSIDDGRQDFAVKSSGNSVIRVQIFPMFFHSDYNALCNDVLYWNGIYVYFPVIPNVEF